MLQLFSVVFDYVDLEGFFFLLFKLLDSCYDASQWQQGGLTPVSI